jgi:hypothetical protein
MAGYSAKHRSPSAAGLLRQAAPAHGNERGHGDGARQREPGGRVVEVALRHDRELQQLLPRLQGAHSHVSREQAEQRCLARTLSEVCNSNQHARMNGSTVT